MKKKNPTKKLVLKKIIVADLSHGRQPQLHGNAATSFRAKCQFTCFCVTDEDPCNTFTC